MTAGAKVSGEGALRPERVAVVGGGIMGQGIAALFANEGVDVTVFDVTEERARAARERLLEPEQKLPQLTSPRHGKRIATAATARLAELLPAHDVVVEVVPEVLALKRDVLGQIDRCRRPGSVVSTNTSGLSVRSIVEGCSDDLRACFLGTHYFHPVRYLPLVELIPGPDTRPELVTAYAAWLRRAGKRPVVGRDTPNFIANRVGVYALLKTLALARKHGLGVADVDLVTGPPLGSPRTATFRLADLVGLDTLLHAAQNSHDHCPDDEARADLAPPDVLRALVASGRLGDKTGAGFYRKAGKGEVLELDLETLEYRPQAEPRAELVRAAKGVQAAGDRVKAMVEGDGPGSALARDLVLATGAYALRRVGEVCDDARTLDDAMRWGFGRELGPIEALDAVGLRRVAELLAPSLPPLLERALAAGGAFYGQDAEGRRTCLGVAAPDDPRVLSLARVARGPAVLREDASARLVDLGDGVLLCEPAVKALPALNPLDDGVLAAVERAHDEVASGRFRALVIGNQAPSFCAGANLKAVLALARAGEHDRIRALCRALQGLTLRALHAPYPVVVAPHGQTLGGGLELALGGQVRVAARELYCGLVEAGVGLVPAGGGCLRLLQLQQQKRNRRGGPLGPMQAVLAAFDLIGLARVSTSAEDAKDRGLLAPDDVVVAAGDELLARAKEVALARLAAFKPIPPQPLSLPGRGGYLVLEDTVRTLELAGKVTPHGARIARVQARILTGGDAASPVEPLAEEALLELEREAFVELCQEPLTQARMEHMLKTGKPLLN